MDNKDLGQLVVRIDERTANMERRQLEEIEKREKLTSRVESLEGWRNILVGAHAAVTSSLAAIGIYIRSKH